MRRAHLFSLLHLLLVLPGCQTALPLASVPSPGRGLVVELALPRQVQATVSRHLTADIDHYSATLLLWDGDSFGPLPTPLSATTAEKIRPKFAFDHLGPGRYQVRAVGYDGTNTPLTSEGIAVIDLTGNDVSLSPQVTVPLSMLPVVFSATLALPSDADGTAPGWATGLEAVVSVGGVEVARHSYTPDQEFKLKNLAAGPTYDVGVTASDGLGHSEANTFQFCKGEESLAWKRPIP